MYEVIQVTDRCYYFQSPAKIGLVKLGGHDVCLPEGMEAIPLPGHFFDMAGFNCSF